MILTDPECTSVSAVCGVYELLYDGDERPSLPYSILSTPLSCVSSCIRPVFFAVYGRRGTVSFCQRGAAFRLFDAFSPWCCRTRRFYQSPCQARG